MFFNPVVYNDFHRNFNLSQPCFPRLIKWGRLPNLYQRWWHENMKIYFLLTSLYIDISNVNQPQLLKGRRHKISTWQDYRTCMEPRVTWKHESILSFLQAYILLFQVWTNISSLQKLKRERQQNFILTDLVWNPE